MGAGKVWRAKFFAENPHLRTAAQREQEAWDRRDQSDAEPGILFMTEDLISHDQQG
jgi:hypothetical protein